MLEIDLLRHVKVSGKPALYGHSDIEPLGIDNDLLLEQLISQQKTKKAYQHIICSPLVRCQKVARMFSERCEIPLTLSDDLKEMDFGVFDGLPFDDIPYDLPLNKIPLNKPTLNSSELNQSELNKSVLNKSELNKSELNKSELNQSELNKSALNESPQNKLNVSKNTQWSLLEGFFDAPAINTLPEAESLTSFHLRVTETWTALVAKQLSIATKSTKNGKSKPPRRVLILAHGGVIRMILAHILQVDWRKASWYQQLHIGHASLSNVSIEQVFQGREYPQLHQQVTTIAMPLIKELPIDC